MKPGRFEISPGRVPELSWSICHASDLALPYIRRVLTAAKSFDVDTIELCGGCHGRLQGLEGGIFYNDYPRVRQQLDAGAIRKNIRLLRTIADMTHKEGMPLYYWHREICVPSGIFQSEPKLLDDRGEFNLLGRAYERLLKNKLAEFFDNIPEIDGLVLTLTEADYSVIHTSRPDLYPPAKVVRKLLETFSLALKKRGKRFIFRTFGSIEQDHRDLFAGATAARGASFEMETKVTPFDWHPFLSFNPWLKRVKGQRMSVELDAMGEYYAPGLIPSPCPSTMLRQLRHAQAQKVDRVTIRIDRGASTSLGSVQEINLAAATLLLRNPDTNAPAVWKSWAASHWGQPSREVTRLLERNFEVIKKTRYIAGNLIFHTFPISPKMEYLKLGGIFSVFQSSVPLHNQSDMWSILYRQKTPSARRIHDEKAEAVDLARELLLDFLTHGKTLPPKVFSDLRVSLENNLAISILFQKFCATIAGYFKNMKAAAHETDFRRGCDEHISFFQSTKSAAIARTHARPMAALLRSLRTEYRAESAARKYWTSQSDVIDFVVCGGITDEYRVRRFLHGSGTSIRKGRPARAVGNSVFPNGFLEFDLGKPSGRARVEIQFSPGTAALIDLQIDSVSHGKTVPSDGILSLEINSSRRHVRVRISRGDALYPWVHAVATRRAADLSG